jgi:hypothetical protein
MITKPRTLLGPVQKVGFPELDLSGVSARVDTGARTSAVWASGIREKDGVLSFKLFDKANKHYSGEVIRTQHYSRRSVTSSIGIVEERYMIKLLILIKGRKIKASFTLANRSKQVYPVLIGRNVLRGKFVVDVKADKSPIKKGENS